MAVVWLGFLCDINVSIISSITKLYNLSEIFCSLTVLGLGNTIGDLFVDMSLSKNGYEVMAFTGIFVGQLTNVLIGLG